MVISTLSPKARGATMAETTDRFSSQPSSATIAATGAG